MSPANLRDLLRLETQDIIYVDASTQQARPALAAGRAQSAVNSRHPRRNTTEDSDSEEEERTERRRSCNINGGSRPILHAKRDPELLGDLCGQTHKSPVMRIQPQRMKKPLPSSPFST